MIKLFSFLERFQNKQPISAIRPIVIVRKTVGIEDIIMANQNIFGINSTGWQRWEYVVCHHSWTKDSGIKDTIGIDNYHRSYAIDGEIVSKDIWEKRFAMRDGREFKKPWRKIGYHFTQEIVGSEITVFKGRELSEIGAHSGPEFNFKGIGYCFIGEFDSKKPSEEILNLGAFVIAKLIFVFNINLDRVIGHRDTYKLLNKKVEKSCPGKQFDLNALRDKIKKITPEMMLSSRLN